MHQDKKYLTQFTAVLCITGSYKNLSERDFTTYDHAIFYIRESDMLYILLGDDEFFIQQIDHNHNSTIIARTWHVIDRRPYT